VITGFNTDVKHGDRVFHVQTEDRGLGNPVVESLVYVGGEILLSKKSPYKEHVAGDRVDEKAVREMMDLQHRRIIEAIRRGRFDGAKPGGAAGPAPAEPVAPEPRVSAAAAAAAAAILSSKSGPLPALRLDPAPPSKTPRPGPAPFQPPVSGGMRRTTPGPSAGRAASGVGSPGERSLDQVIIDYLASEAASEHLELSIVTGGDILSGESVSVQVRAVTSLTEKPLAGVHVSIRVVSTLGPPQILFRGVTGSDGLVKATVAIPEIGTGNAALIIAASSPIGNNEIKQLVKKRSR
jgi:hypothetical protein